MEAKPYLEEKRRILTERSAEDFVTFLQEVTDQTGNQFIREKLLQNEVRGFRPGRAPLSRTVPILIAKLKSEQEFTNRDSPIWDALTNAWMFWVKSHPKLNEILITFDNGADFDENHNCVIPPNSELDIECFQFLLKASHNTWIHREMIRRFYEYGYFNEDERIQNLINQVPSREEIEQKEQLAELCDKVAELSQAIDRLSQNMEILDYRVSAVESAEELEQRLTEQITDEHRYFDRELQKLERKAAEQHNLLDARLSNAESGYSQLVNLVKRISLLESRISELNVLINSFKDKVSEIESLNRQKISQLVDMRVQDRIKQLDSGMSEINKSFEARFDAIESAIVEIKSKIVDRPKIAAEAVRLGEHYRTQLRSKTERYSDENDYLSDFTSHLRRCGVTGSEETAAAIHIAMKAFPVLEVSDARLVRVWRVMCSDHLYSTTINIELGWLGLQDWFPDLFSERCFKERLERTDLEISIRKMLELGDMLWMICFRNCDRSFPESYLPGFLDWISEFCKGGIRLFLMRCSSTNRCETNEDFYESVAHLPKPDNPKSVHEVNLRDSRIPLTLSEWENWCCPHSDTDSHIEKQFEFLTQLAAEIEGRDMQIPPELLPEIQNYLRLSYNIIAPTRALDWALTLRLLPWIGKRRHLIDVVRNLVNEEHQELPHFREGLQTARDSDG